MDEAAAKGKKGAKTAEASPVAADEKPAAAEGESKTAEASPAVSEASKKSGKTVWKPKEKK